jgi:hypothetical protein
MRCTECDLIIDGDNWIMLTVKDDDEYTTGVICSTDHLIDYVAAVRAMETDSNHERWNEGGDDDSPVA